MFKNAIIYKAVSIPNWMPKNSIEEFEFAPCTPSQEKSIGWAPPREEHGPLVEFVGNHKILKLVTETKKVPADVIKRKLAERVAQIEASTGRKPGKKEKRELKDDIKLELLPMAFSSLRSSLVWIDDANLTVVVEAASQSQADDVVTMLVKSIDGLALALVNTSTSPTVAMSNWLITQEPPQSFSVDRECILKATDESKATIKYGRHPLDIDEVKENVQSGKLPTQLAMTWDSRVSFVLTEGMRLKKISFLDIVFEGSGQKSEDDGFDADVAIFTGELSKLIPDLIEALDGEPDESEE